MAQPDGGPVLQAEALLATLDEHGVAFVIIGGFALAAHGVVRGTKDIDIVPDPRADNLERLAGALRSIGAEVMLADDFDPSELACSERAGADESTALPATGGARRRAPPARRGRRPPAGAPLAPARGRPG